MDAVDFMDFIDELYREASKDPETQAVADAVPDGLQVQYEISGLPEYDHYQEYTRSGGLAGHPGKAPKAGFWFNMPNMEVWEELCSGRMATTASAAHGVTWKGPVYLLMKFTPVMPAVAKVYEAIRSKYPE